MFGIERARLEFRNVLSESFLIEDRLHFRIIDRVDLAHFVGGSESVEEVDKGNAGTKRRKMRNEREIHNFLYGTACDHRKTRLAASHYVGMVSEDIQRMRRNRARRNVHDHGQKFARDLIHIGDHEEQALRCGIRCRERAGGERTVHGACRAALRLHFRNAEFLPPHVESALCRPFIRRFSHRGRRGDGVDRRYFGKRISNVRGGCIAVDCHLSHLRTSIKIIFFCVMGKPKERRLSAAVFYYIIIF